MSPLPSLRRACASPGRRRRGRAAPFAVTTVGVALGAALLAAPPATAAEIDPDPLEVHIDRLRPAAVPDAGQAVQVTGEVTNRSEEEWSSINLHVFTGASPITTADDLALAVESDPADFVGERIVTPGTFDTVDSLGPGETARFRMEVPREELSVPGSPGVYWVGVHALGDASEPRDSVADGKARTFVPQLTGLPARGRDVADPVPTAVVVPLRADVAYDPDGRVTDLETWTRDLSEGGRLDDLLDLDDLAGGRSLTWLVDPAVLTAVQHLAGGNPERSLAPRPGRTGSAEDGEGTADPDADETDGATPSEDPTDDEPTEEETAAAEAADAWLDRFVAATSDEDVLALPYGDLDVAAASRQDPQTYRRALERSAQVMEGLGVTAGLAVAPPGGTLPAAALEQTPTDVTVLVRDSLLSQAPGSSGLVRVGGRALLATSTGASAGGPLPGAPHDPLALRQRMLSEAALQRLDASPAPVVTMLPDRWHPSSPEPFFARAVPAWTDAVTISDLADGGPGGDDLESSGGATLAYPAQARAAELDATAFTAVAALRRPADIIDSVLTDGGTVAAQVADTSLTTLSYADRDGALEALSRARATRAALTDQLSSITVEAPSSVTLSSETGRLGATVVNGLDVPVTVRLDLSSDVDLQMVQEQVVEVDARSRTRLNLEITTQRLGIHDVRLVVTDLRGRPLGSEAALPVRAAQVSDVIWVIIAIAGAGLLVAIVVRLVRRVRGRDGRTA